MKTGKNRSTLNSRQPFLMVAIMLLVLRTLSPALAQQSYENSAVLSASKILPPELMAGPNFRVQERVSNDGYLNILFARAPAQAASH